MNREIVQHVLRRDTAARRAAAYFVGEGTSIVGDKVLEWSKHDCFAVPNWAWHEHVNRSKSEAAILFSFADTPVLKAFDLYREEAYAENQGRQPVEAMF